MRSPSRDIRVARRSHSAADLRTSKAPSARGATAAGWLAAVALVWSVGCGALAPAPTPDPKTVVIPVDGMVCDACAKSIDLEVEKVAGVETCEITFEAGAATVRYDANTTDPAAITAAIDKLGYHAGEPQPAS